MGAEESDTLAGRMLALNQKLLGRSSRRTAGPS
jgi:hypothetical protein